VDCLVSLLLMLGNVESNLTKPSGTEQYDDKELSPTDDPRVSRDSDRDNSSQIRRWTPNVEKVRLTQRELDIVSAVVAGYSNKEIAEYFKIAEDTVKHHLATSSTRSAFQRGWNSHCLP